MKTLTAVTILDANGNDWKIWADTEELNSNSNYIFVRCNKSYWNIDRQKIKSIGTQTLDLGKYNQVNVGEPK